MELNRRGFLGGLLAVMAAPAIVRPEILMPVRSIIFPSAPKIIVTGAHGSLQIDVITREAIRLFQNSNKFIQAINMEYDEAFAFVGGSQWGEALKIRLPTDF